MQYTSFKVMELQKNQYRTLKKLKKSNNKLLYLWNRIIDKFRRNHREIS